MSSPREFMDCRYCNEATGHTRTAGCIIAVERAAAVNEVTQPINYGVTAAQRLSLWLDALSGDASLLAQIGESPEQQDLFVSDLREVLSIAENQS